VSSIMHDEVDLSWDYITCIFFWFNRYDMQCMYVALVFLLLLLTCAHCCLQNGENCK
jgi:hypothetical protein